MGIANAPTGPTNATASMKHTNADEMSIVPSQSDAKSTLTIAQAASTSVKGSVIAVSDDEVKTSGNAVQQKAQSRRDCGSGPRALRCIAHGVNVPAARGANAGRQVVRKAPPVAARIVMAEMSRG